MLTFTHNSGIANTPNVSTIFTELRNRESEVSIAMSGISDPLFGTSRFGKNDLIGLGIPGYRRSNSDSTERDFGQDMPVEFGID